MSILNSSQWTINVASEAVVFPLQQFPEDFRASEDCIKTSLYVVAIWILTTLLHSIVHCIQVTVTEELLFVTRTGIIVLWSSPVALTTSPLPSPLSTAHHTSINPSPKDSGFIYAGIKRLPNPWKSTHCIAWRSQYLTSNMVCSPTLTFPDRPKPMHLQLKESKLRVYKLVDWRSCLSHRNSPKAPKKTW